MFVCDQLLFILHLMLISVASTQNFVSLLPIAGRTGSLANRFRGTAAGKFDLRAMSGCMVSSGSFTDRPLLLPPFVTEGILKAKTGSLTGVTTLSGYVANPHFRNVIFSVFSNNCRCSASQARAVVDTLGVWLSEMEDC